VVPRASLDVCGKSRPPPGFGIRTAQPVASRYTGYAIPAALAKGLSEVCEPVYRTALVQFVGH